MGGFSRVKSKGENRFGEVPKPSETKNLEAPETAPLDIGTNSNPKRKKASQRTEPFNFRVTKELEEEFELICFKKKLMKIELLEMCFEAYKELHGIDKDGGGL